MQSRDVILIGAGGHGKVIADILLCSGTPVRGFLDDREGACAAGLPWLGSVEEYRRFPDAEFLIAVGDARTRRRIALAMDGVRWHTAVHPHAVVSSLEVEIGEGTVVMAGAVVNPGARIGRHCIINTGAVVEHDNDIGEFVHVSVGAHLCGGVRVGGGTWIGAGACVRNNLSVCENVMIGTGGVVVKDIVCPGTYVGVPAISKKFQVGGCSLTGSKSLSERSGAVSREKRGAAA